MRIEPRSTFRARRSRGAWLRLLSEVLDLAGPRAEVLHHHEKPWSSATFTGTRHTIALAFPGTEAIASGETYIAALPEHEFTLPGQLVADATVIAVEHAHAPAQHMTVEAELLLIEDG